MDWNKLKYFYYAAKAGSFTIAAKHLGIDPSVLSRQVNSLEEMLGTKLYERHFRGIYLTKDGEELFQSARIAYRELELAEARIKGRDNKVEGPLRIASTIGLSSDWIPNYIPGFLKRYPKIQLSIVSHTENLDLQAREADAAIRPAMKEDSDLVQLFLKTFYFRLYASPEYLKEFGTPHNPSDLDHHRLITFPRSPSSPFSAADYLLYIGTKPEQMREPFLEVNNNVALLALAKNGLGIVSLSTDAAFLKNSGLIEVLPDVKGVEIDVFYIFPKQLEHIKRVTAFGKYLKDNLAGSNT